MPLYTYTCPKCEHTFEALIFGNEAAECPECHNQALERQWDVPARPQTAPLPTACNSSGPPCGPACRRWPN
jgi:putative FmdB family regulatory protein